MEGWMDPYFFWDVAASKLDTLPETNVFTPENRPGPNRKVVFQPSIFRGELLVSGRVCSVITTVFLYEKTCMATKDTRRGTIESRLVYGVYIPNNGTPNGNKGYPSFTQWPKKAVPPMLDNTHTAKGVWIPTSNEKTQQTAMVSWFVGQKKKTW